MNNTERLIQRYLNGQATPGEIHKLHDIAAKGGLSLEELVMSNAFEAYNDYISSNEATESEFDPESFYQKKLSPVLPKRVQDTPENRETNVIPIKRNFRWLQVAAAITALMVASGFLYYKYYTGAPETVSFTYKGKGIVPLPDNSFVIMNEGSTLTLSSAFGESKREVFLTGEALFEVAHDATKPFIVNTRDVQTTVLGTKFNVREAEGNVTITVAEGLVKVADDQRMREQISPNEQIEVNINTNRFTRRKVKAEEALAWQKDFLILRNITFSEAAARIEKRFNVKVTIANDALKDCTVIASFMDNATLKEAITGLCGSHQAKPKYQENNVILIEGGICNSQE